MIDFDANSMRKTPLPLTSGTLSGKNVRANARGAFDASIRMALTVTLLCLAAARGQCQTFVKHSRVYPVGANPMAIAAADLNGDDLPEIVTADCGILRPPLEENPANDTLSYLVATGNVGYVSMPPLRCGFGPYAVTLANMDALKALDIVVGCFHAVEGRNLTLLRNIQANDVFEPLNFSVPTAGLPYLRMLDGENQPVFTSPGVTALVVRDFNGDGYRDVAAAGWSSDLLIYWPGQNEGFLGDPVLTRAPGAPRDIASVDLNNDGAPDLATTMYAGQAVALWRGDGRGGFEEFARVATRGRLPHKIRLGDVNRDGRTDLIVTHRNEDDAVEILYGDESLSFRDSQMYLFGDDPALIEHDIRDIVVEDLNGDGTLDMAVACAASGQIKVLLNTSSGSALPQTFHEESYTYKDPGARPQALCPADINLDGKRDLAIALSGANAVAILLAR